ncbi:MAG: MFS transporter [Sphingomicrobium sp.]
MSSSAIAAPRWFGDHRNWFWIGCAMIAAGVLMHLPMLAEAHAMHNRLVGMAIGPQMVAGMALIIAGVPIACWGALGKWPRSRASLHVVEFDPPHSAPLNRWHVGVLLVLTLGLVIDVMKPATLGFVLPGLAKEYGIPRSTAALLPFVALIGTTVGSFLWGWIADIYGRRSSILLSTILFVATSICGAMPRFEWNLVMCFLMGCSAGGMLPVVYTLLAEIMPARQRSWILVLVGGTGLVGGYLAASGAAHVFEPHFGWRFLWLQGFPTGLLLLALARLIPESPHFLRDQGRLNDLRQLEDRFGIRPVRAATDDAEHAALGPDIRLTVALAIAALSWSFVNFGLLLWLPSDLQQRGYSSALASGIIASSALLAFPTIMIVAWLYARWSSKWTLVGTIAVTFAGLLGALLPAQQLAHPLVLVLIVALLIVGANGMIAVLLPYTAETYRVGIRGRATGLVAGSSKFGGVAVQAFALLGFIPTLAGAGAALLSPTLLAGALIGWAGKETSGRSLPEVEMAQAPAE